MQLACNPSYPPVAAVSPLGFLIAAECRFPEIRALPSQTALGRGLEHLSYALVTPPSFTHCRLAILPTRGSSLVPLSSTRHALQVLLLDPAPPLPPPPIPSRSPAFLCPRPTSDSLSSPSMTLSVTIVTRFHHPSHGHLQNRHFHPNALHLPCSQSTPPPRTPPQPLLLSSHPLTTAPSRFTTVSAQHHPSLGSYA